MGKLIISWVINSINQSAQRIYRTVEGGAEELIATIGVAETSYIDEAGGSFGPSRVDYRV